jgi:NAD(P)-dependent dehydrogenase (short-subunit alcohol dehydrogenase family)
MTAELADKVALIAGGSRGMGAAEARLFVEHGAKAWLSPR